MSEADRPEFSHWDWLAPKPKQPGTGNLPGGVHPVLRSSTWALLKSSKYTENPQRIARRPTASSDARMTSAGLRSLPRLVSDRRPPQGCLHSVLKPRLPSRRSLRPLQGSRCEVIDDAFVAWFGRVTEGETRGVRVQSSETRAIRVQNRLRTKAYQVFMR